MGENDVRTRLVRNRGRLATGLAFLAVALIAALAVGVPRALGPGAGGSTSAAATASVPGSPVAVTATTIAATRSAVPSPTPHPSLPTPPARTAGSGVIPWTAATPRPTPQPTPTPVPTLPSVPQCTSGQLTLTATVATGRTPGSFLQLVMTNRSESECYLLGSPSVRFLEGDREFSTARRATDMDAAPVTLRPGDQAATTAFWVSDDTCVPLALPASVSVTLATGGEVRAGVRLNEYGSVCADGRGAGWPVVVNPFGPYGLPIPPEPDPLPTLTLVSMQLPDYAVAGRPMHYTIVLENDSDTPYPLEPCPGYTQSILGMPDHDRAGAIVYLLNCPAIGTSIAPHRRLTLEMVYVVPAATPAGKQTFFWDGCGTGNKTRLDVRAG